MRTPGIQSILDDVLKQDSVYLRRCTLLKRLVDSAIAAVLTLERDLSLIVLPVYPKGVICEFAIPTRRPRSGIEMPLSSIDTMCFLRPWLGFARCGSNLA